MRLSAHTTARFARGLVPALPPAAAAGAAGAAAGPASSAAVAAAWFVMGAGLALRACRVARRALLGASALFLRRVTLEPASNTCSGADARRLRDAVPA